MANKKAFRFSSLFLSLFVLFSFVGGNLTPVFATNETGESAASSSISMSQPASSEDEPPQSEAPVSSSLPASSEDVQSELPASSSEVVQSNEAPASSEASSQLPAQAATEAPSSESTSEEEGVTFSIEELISLARTSGNDAAVMLNSCTDNDEFLAALQQVLTIYYEEELTQQLAEFTKAIDARANELLLKFANAAKERANAISEGFMPGEVLVIFNENVSQTKQEDIIDAQDGNTMQTLEINDGGDVAVAEIATDQTVQEAAQELAQNPNVAFAQPNYIYKKLGTEVGEIGGEISDGVNGKLSGENTTSAVIDVANDPLIYHQWYLNAINAQEAWRLAEQVPTAAPVRVAVIDSMVDINHPDLFNPAKQPQSINPNHTWDFSSGYQQPATYVLPDPHGTHVAGTIAAQTNNGIGVAGVANTPNKNLAEIMALNVFIGDDASSYAIFAAIGYAADNGARIISMSLGHNFHQGETDYAFEAAINSATAKNVLCIAAAGNNGYFLIPTYPSDFENIFSVIALNRAGTRATFSNYGANKNIAAPGVDIANIVPNVLYLYMDGTSMAAPIVSGVAALMLAVDPSLSPAEVRDIIEATASNSAKTSETGWGLINAAAAVEKASDMRAIEFSPADLQMFLSDKLKLNPIIKPTVGDGIIEWESSEPGIASIDANGIVTAHIIGSTVITAKLTNKRTATCNIAIISPVTSVRFAQKTVRLALKKNFTLSPVVYTSNGSSSKVVSFTSSRPGTVSVSSNGRIKARRVGKAVITAKTNNGKKAKVTVVVTKKAVGVKSLKITGAPKKLAVGKTKYISGKMAPSNATGAKLTFKSSNRNIATIDAAGKITAKKAGTVKITVSGGGKKSVVAVKITKK